MNRSEKFVTKMTGAWMYRMWLDMCQETIIEIKFHWTSWTLISRFTIGNNIIFNLNKGSTDGPSFDSFSLDQGEFREISKLWFLSLNCYFWWKITEMITKVNSLIFRRHPIYGSRDFPENGHSDNDYFREKF